MTKPIDKSKEVRELCLAYESKMIKLLQQLEQQGKYLTRGEVIKLATNSYFLGVGDGASLLGLNVIVSNTGDVREFGEAM